jgi:hypothetical protein
MIGGRADETEPRDPPRAAAFRDLQGRLIKAFDRDPAERRVLCSHGSIMRDDHPPVEARLDAVPLGVAVALADHAETTLGDLEEFAWALPSILAWLASGELDPDGGVLGYSGSACLYRAVWAHRGWTSHRDEVLPARRLSECRALAPLAGHAQLVAEVLVSLLRTADGPPALACQVLLACAWFAAELQCLAPMRESWLERGDRQALLMHLAACEDARRSAPVVEDLVGEGARGCAYWTPDVDLDALCALARFLAESTRQDRVERAAALAEPDADRALVAWGVRHGPPECLWPEAWQYAVPPQ